MNEMDNLIKNYFFHCRYEKNLSPHSIKAYSIDLRQFNAFLAKNYNIINVSDINKSILRKYLEWLFTNYKPKSIKRKIATLKTFFSFIEYEEILNSNPFRKLKIRIKEPKQIPKTIPFNEIKKLFTYLFVIKNKTNNGSPSNTILRDLTIIELLFASGARVSEISNLKKKDINLDNWEIKITAKGNKERKIYICNTATRRIVKEYFDYHEHNYYDKNHFFLNRLGNKLSSQSIRLMIKKYALDSNLEQHITPHMFRHSLATLLVKEGVDIIYVQKLLGHSSIKTTQIYVEIDNKSYLRILTNNHPRRRINLI